MNKDSRIYVAGHTGLAGGAILKELIKRSYHKISYETHENLNLEDPNRVFNWFFEESPEYVFLCAAYTGGIKTAIDNPVDMLLKNARIQNNVIEACYEYNVKKLLFLGSSCIYPVNGEQPYKEEQLGEGRTDENWSYAIGKLAGIQLVRSYHCQYNCNFITAIPCNLYGPNDRYELDSSHVIPALIRKIHEAKVSDKSFVEAWGTGHVKREFLHTADFANACVGLMENHDYGDFHKLPHLMQVFSDGVINVGSSIETSIVDLATLLCKIIGYEGQIKFNGDNPGVESKLMDSSRIAALGWSPQISLEDGLQRVYEDWSHNQPCSC